MTSNAMLTFQDSDEDFEEQHAVCGPPAPVVYKSKPPSKNNIKVTSGQASSEFLQKTATSESKQQMIEAALRSSKSNSASVKPNLVCMMNAPKSPTDPKLASKVKTMVAKKSGF